MELSSKRNTSRRYFGKKNTAKRHLISQKPHVKDGSDVLEGFSSQAVSEQFILTLDALEMKG